MSMMDKLKQMMKGHESQVGKGVDKAGDAVDKKTGDKYKSQVDTGQDQLKNRFGSDGDQGGQPRS